MQLDIYMVPQKKTFAILWGGFHIFAFSFNSWMMLSYSGQDCDSLNALLDFWRRQHLNNRRVCFQCQLSHVLLPIPSETVISQVKNTAVNTDVFGGTLYDVHTHTITMTICRQNAVSTQRWDQCNIINRTQRTVEYIMMMIILIMTVYD